MKKLFKILMVMALVIGVSAPLAFAGYYHYEIQVYSDKNNSQTKVNPTLEITGITYKVLTVDSDTAATIYSDKVGTSKTNPVTTTVFAADDKIDFYVSDSVSSVDIIIVDTDGGYTLFLEGATHNTRTAIIDERPNIQHHGCIWFSYNSGVETDTGINFQYDTTIHSVQLEIVTIDAGEDIDIGLLSTETSGDADGFIVDGSTATAGYVVQSAANMGALLDDATNFLRHTVSSANAQSMTYTGSEGCNSAAGYIHYYFTRTR